MKRILCYGDSNTWGCSPHDSSRYNEQTRWPLVMQSRLGEKYLVIEDGFNGRTVLNLSPADNPANGIEWIESVINSYTPLDIAVISLGLNDVFVSENSPLSEISDGVEKIIDTIRGKHTGLNLKLPEIIIMAPPEYNSEVEGSVFFELQINKLKALPETYRKLSLEERCYFFNSSDFVKGSIIDGSHLEAESHIILGQKIAEFILSRIK